jgi:predicted amidohydrolase YtcJ
VSPVPEVALPGRSLLLLALAVGVVPGAGAAPPPADLVLRGGIVHTLDAKKPLASAVAISRGLIVGVGTDAEMTAFVGPRTTLVALEGRTLIPGFEDSHAHLMGIGKARMTVDLVGAKTYAEVVDRVRAALRGHRPGEWIRGRGWHEEKWTSLPADAVRGFPTEAALSRVTPNNPVILERADGHAVLLNARALALMGIDDATKPPEGGEVIKDAAGHPTGILVDQAESLVHAPEPTPEESERALDLAQEECVRKGITSLDDAGVSGEVIGLYRRRAEKGTLSIRIYAMVRGLEALKAFGPPQIGLGGGFLTIRSVKVFADGALGSRGAALLAPYADDPGNSGFFTTPPETILETARYGLAHGFQVNVHAIGDRANRAVLDAFETALREVPNVTDPRFRVEHAQILTKTDIPRFAQLGVIASMQGIHATSDRPWAPQRLGLARVEEGAYAWRKLLRSGARIINGTDAPIEDVDPIRCFYASVTRMDETGHPPGGFDPDERMTREEALRSYTLEGAFGTFEERTKGSIEVGMVADLTLLSQDIMTVSEPEILKTRVLLTIVAGVVRYDATKADGSRQ